MFACPIVIFRRNRSFVSNTEREENGLFSQVWPSTVLSAREGCRQETRSGFSGADTSVGGHRGESYKTRNYKGGDTIECVRVVVGVGYHF